MKLARWSRILMGGMLVLLGVAASFGEKKSPAEAARAKARHYVLKAAVSEAEEDYDKAYEYYKKGFEIDPTFPDAGYGYGKIRVTMNEDTFTSKPEVWKAMSKMRPLLESHPNDVNIHETYALYAVNSDTLSEALRTYRHLVKQHPGRAELYLPLSYIYSRLDSTDKAVAAIEDFERIEGASTETAVRKIYYYFSAKDTVSALRESQKFCEGLPASEESELTKSFLYKSVGYPDSAFMILQEATRLYPESAPVKYEMANAYLERGDTLAFHSYMGDALAVPSLDDEDVIGLLYEYMMTMPAGEASYKEGDKVFKAVEKRMGENIYFMDIYSNYLSKRGDQEGALKYAKKAFALDPDDSDLLEAIIVTSAKAKRPEEGVKAFKEYRNEERKKTYGLVMAFLSAALQAEAYDDAIAWTDTLLSQCSNGLSITTAELSDSVTYPAEFNTYLQSTLFEIGGDIYARKGDNAAALRNYNNSVALVPTNSSALNNLAYYILDTMKAKPGSKEFERAKEMSRKSIALTEDDPSYVYYDTYAWVLFNEQNYKEAIDYQEMALELAGDEAQWDMYSHYGDMLFMAGRPAEALEQWKKALLLEPGNELLIKKVKHETFFYE